MTRVLGLSGGGGAAVGTEWLRGRHAASVPGRAAAGGGRGGLRPDRGRGQGFSEKSGRSLISPDSGWWPSDAGKWADWMPKSGQKSRLGHGYSTGSRRRWRQHHRAHSSRPAGAASSGKTRHGPARPAAPVPWMPPTTASASERSSRTEARPALITEHEVRHTSHLVPRGQAGGACAEDLDRTKQFAAAPGSVEPGLLQVGAQGSTDPRLAKVAGSRTDCAKSTCKPAVPGWACDSCQQAINNAAGLPVEIVRQKVRRDTPASRTMSADRGVGIPLAATDCASPCSRRPVVAGGWFPGTWWRLGGVDRFSPAPCHGAIADRCGGAARAPPPGLALFSHQYPGSDSKTTGDTPATELVVRRR